LTRSQWLVLDPLLLENLFQRFLIFWSWKYGLQILCVFFIASFKQFTVSVAVLSTKDSDVSVEVFMRYE